MEALTPGHFLITRPLLAPPEPDQLDKNPTTRWKLVTRLYQDLWKRWSTEYLVQLQQRSKWQTAQTDLSVGDLVLIKERDLPPNTWPLGRIIEIHPGDDNKVRLISIVTKGQRIRKQPVNNVCLLPISDDKPRIPESPSKPSAALVTVTALEQYN